MTPEIKPMNYYTPDEKANQVCGLDINLQQIRKKTVLN
jgi:hypothetical protein